MDGGHHKFLSASHKTGLSESYAAAIVTAAAAAAINSILLIVIRIRVMSKRSYDNDNVSCQIFR